MAKHLTKEIEKLKKMILNQGAIVEENFYRSVKAFETGDLDLAKEIIENEPSVNNREIEVEEECLKILALYQPVAFDLRFLVSAFKINNDLERINDLAVNIADRTINLPRHVKVPIPFDLKEMGDMVKKMVKKSLDALVNLNSGTAWQVLTLDDSVDLIHKNSYQAVKDAIVKNPENINELVSYLSLARYLERVADLATNIAEDVIYLIEAEIIRHKEPDEVIDATSIVPD